MKHLTAEWIEKAEEDFFSARHLAGAEYRTPYNAICFHAQQVAEKLLKARLCEDTIAFPKTHDLRQLLLLLKDAYPDWMCLAERVRRLSFYSVSTRYPGDSATREDMEQALLDMGAVRDHIRASFGLW
jgi:HEPN domain-containing protein